MVKRLLKSVFNSSYKNLEVTVVDDASSDGTHEFLQKHFSKNKNLKIIINKKNLYTAGSRNVGLRYSKGDLIFFIDDDNLLEKNAILYLVNTFKDDFSLGEAGLLNYNFNKKNQILWLLTKRNMFTTKTYQPRTMNLVKGKEVWSTADVPNAFMVRADLVKKNKIRFNETFGIMYEESDFAYRIRNLGYTVKVVRNAKIYHDIEVSVKNKKRKDYMYHFMEDDRRPYVFARNRLVFHRLYSTKLQFLLIILFWNWFFTGFYIYKIFFYNGVGEFSILKRIKLSLLYLKGVYSGLTLSLKMKI
jgi:GT2 family glycosyltransferase